MRAVVCERPGPPDVLKVTQLPWPKARPGEVVVAVSHAAITFVETQVRSGILPPMGERQPTFPLVLGNGVTGRVIETGPGVDPGWVGQQVVTATGGSGGYAEYVAVPANLLHTVPAGLDGESAVALLADGRTALALVRAARLGPGDQVLIVAAAGGVGSLLLQLAKGAGAAPVIGLAGGERKIELVRSLGADVAVDYRRREWGQDVWEATHHRGVDVAFDGVGGAVGTGIVELVKAGGRYLPHGMASGQFAQVRPDREHEIEVIPLRSILAGPQDTYDLIEEALNAAAAGRIKPVIGQVFPLERAAEAHAAVEARATVGKTLLAIGAGRAG